MTRQQLSMAGLVGLATGILGALAALVLLAWPAQAPLEQVSYPFTIDGFLVALALSSAIGPGRIARAGAWVAVGGMVMLTFAELLSMRYANWDNEVANAGLMGTSYGVSCTVIGIGMLAAGAGVVRAGVWSGWHRWVPWQSDSRCSRLSRPACSAGSSSPGWRSASGCCCSPLSAGACTFTQDDSRQHSSSRQPWSADRPAHEAGAAFTPSWRIP